jgi:predicted amidophosphoribosyltransferase
VTRTERNGARANAWADAKYAAGLCVQCGREPHAPNRVRCDGCNALMKLRQRKPRARVCSTCRSFSTHDARNCPQRVAA